MNHGLLAAYSSPPITLILSVTQLCRGYFKHVFGALGGVWFAFSFSENSFHFQEIRILKICLV